MDKKGVAVITARQLKDGRKLLDWSAQRLADEAGVSLDTVQKIEWGKTDIDRARFRTVYSIVRALEQAGIEFLNDGTARRRHGVEPGK